MPCLMQPRIPLVCPCGTLSGRDTLLAHVLLDIHQYPQVHFNRAAFQLDGTQHILVHGVVPSPVQEFAFLHGDLHEVPVSLFLQPTEIPLAMAMQLSGKLVTAPRFLFI